MIQLDVDELGGKYTIDGELIEARAVLGPTEITYLFDGSNLQEKIEATIDSINGLRKQEYLVDLFGFDFFKKDFENSSKEEVLEALKDFKECKPDAYCFGGYSILNYPENLQKEEVSKEDEDNFNLDELTWTAFIQFYKIVE